MVGAKATSNHRLSELQRREEAARTSSPDRFDSSAVVTKDDILALIMQRSDVAGTTLSRHTANRVHCASAGRGLGRAAVI